MTKRQAVKKENIKGAKAVGMHGILFTDVEQLTRELAKLGVKIR